MGTKKAIAAILETALRIIILIIVASIVYKAGNSAYDFGYRIFSEKPMTLGNGRNVVVTIPEDQSPREVGEILRQHGLIRDANLFFCQELLSAYHGKLEPGTYTLNTSMTSTQMMAVMAESHVDSEADTDEENTDEEIIRREDIEDMEPLPQADESAPQDEGDGGSDDSGDDSDEAGDSEGPERVDAGGDIDVIDAVVEENR
jgi:UPF0755 protein